MIHLAATSHSRIVLFVCLFVSQEWTKLEMIKGVPWPEERDYHAACCLNYGEEDPKVLITGEWNKNGSILQDA